MAYEQDERGVPINQKTHEELMEEIERVKAERAEKVHEERAQKKEKELPKKEEHQSEFSEDYSNLKDKVGNEIEKAKEFGHAVVGLGDRTPIGEKIYSNLKEKYTKFREEQKVKSEKQKIRDEKLEEARFNRKLKQVSSGEEQRHRRVQEDYEPRTKKSGKAVAGGFNLKSVKQPKRQEYRPQPKQDVFGMSGIFGGVSAPKTNIGTQRQRKVVRTEVKRQGRADEVLGLTSWSVVGNVPSTNISSPKRSMEPQGRVIARENAVSILGLGGFGGVGRNPVQSKVEKSISTKLSKESKIKTRIPLQKEDPLGTAKYF